MRCPTCGRENPPVARFCMACGRPLSARSSSPFLLIVPALLILGLRGGVIALIPALSARTAVRGQPERTAGGRFEAGPVSSPSPVSTPTRAYRPITAESVSRLRRIGRLNLNSHGGEWLPSSDWKVWAETAGNRIYVHRFGGSEATLIEGPDTLSAVAVAPDGSRIAAAVSGDRLMLWDAVTGEVLMDQEVPVYIPGGGRSGVYPPIFNRQIDSLVFSPGGRYLAGCCPESRGTDQMRTIWVYDAQAGAPLGALDAEVLGFAWSSEDELLLIYREPSSLFRPRSASLVTLHVPSMRVEPLFVLEDMPSGKLIVAPDGSRVAVFLDQQRIQIFSLPAGQAGPLIEVPGPISLGEVRAAFTPDGQLLITESNNTLRFWRTEDGRRVHLIDDAGRLIGASPDGLWIATEGYGAPWIWAVSIESSP